MLPGSHLLPAGWTSGPWGQRSCPAPGLGHFLHSSFSEHLRYACLGRKPGDTEPLVAPGSLGGALALSKGLRVQPPTGGCDPYPMLWSWNSGTPFSQSMSGLPLLCHLCSRCALVVTSTPGSSQLVARAA